MFRGIGRGVSSAAVNIGVEGKRSSDKANANVSKVMGKFKKDDMLQAVNAYRNSGSLRIRSTPSRYWWSRYLTKLYGVDIAPGEAEYIINNIK